MGRVGFVLNPVAGMGGRVGLKGTDGVFEEAVRRGGKPVAPDRGRNALRALKTHGVDTLITVAGVMGAEAARDAGFDPIVVCEPAAGVDAEIGATSAQDTATAVAAFVEAAVDVIVFVGGDGTAVDVARALDSNDAEVPILGVPAGVKVYSGVFALDPESAGAIIASYERTEPATVLDLDEDAYRRGEIVTELQATARTPIDDRRQSPKQHVGGSIETLADAVASEMRTDTTYVLGPGGTVGAIKSRLGFDGSALGVDVWRDGEVLVADGDETAILQALSDRNVVIVSPIGGQGFVFGRGNQQLSPTVLRKCDVEIVASRRKLDDLGVLHVDTGDPALDENLRGWHRIRVGRVASEMMRIT